MFRKNQLRKLVLCLGLSAASFLGVLIRPDEMEDLLRNARNGRIERSVGENNGGSGDSDDPGSS